MAIASSISRFKASCLSPGHDHVKCQQRINRKKRRNEKTFGDSAPFSLWQQPQIIWREQHDFRLTSKGHRYRYDISTEIQGKGFF